LQSNFYPEATQIYTQQLPPTPEWGKSVPVTALQLAAVTGHSEVARVLLEKGADPKLKDIDGKTALHTATLKGHEAVVRQLIEKGADLKLTDNLGRIALYYAALSSHEGIARLLIENGSNVRAKDKTKLTALHAAAMRHIGVTRLLLATQDK
jgi:ankyrin repeat protein